MIYLLSGMLDRMLDFTGQWWFTSQTPLDLDPVPPTVTDTDTDAYYEDDGLPIPPPAGDDKPRCTACGDPNFSLDKEFCLTCRLGMPSSKSPS